MVLTMIRIIRRETAHNRSIVSSFKYGKKYKKACEVQKY